MSLLSTGRRTVRRGLGYRVSGRRPARSHARVTSAGDNPWKAVRAHVVDGERVLNVTRDSSGSAVTLKRLVKADDDKYGWFDWIYNEVELGRQPEVDLSGLSSTYRRTIDFRPTASGHDGGNLIDKDV